MLGSLTNVETGWAPTIRRSVALFRAFRLEQSDPAGFYAALARDSVAQLAAHADLDGAVMLDVGSGPGHFGAAFRAAGATYVGLDSDPAVLDSGVGPHAVLGSALDLPFPDAAFDVCFSSNVLEHVSDPWRMAEEMLRVTRRGGLVFISYTTWFGPWGGHETSPWHYLGGRRARNRYRRRHGHDPKNTYGETLFAVTVAAGLRWARAQRSADVVATIPRYHPRFAHGLVRIPVLREVATWNLLLVLRKR